MTVSSRMRILGVFPVFFYAVHGAFWVTRGYPENALWTCHLASLLIGLGIVLTQPRFTAVGTLWVMMGLPIWILDLSAGGEFLPTSALTHVGAPIVAFFFFRRVSFPRGSWWRAVIALGFLVLLTRLITPPGENVNLAHAIWKGWEGIFYHSHAAYLGFFLFVSAMSFLAGEAVLGRWSRGRSSATVPTGKKEVM